MINRSLLALSGIIALLAIAPMTTSAQEDVPPLDYFATYPFMTGVSLSPDGEQIALLRLPGKTDEYILEVYEVDDLAKEPARYSASPSEITSFSWANKDHIFVRFRQKVRDQITDVNQGVYEGQVALLNLNTGRFRELPRDASFQSRLRGRPNEILISTRDIDFDDLEGESISGAQAPDFYVYNLRNNRKSMYLKGNRRLGDYGIDSEGNVRTASEVDIGTREAIYFYRELGESDEWKEWYRFSLENYQNYGQLGIDPIGIDPQNPNQIFLRAHRGQNTVGVHLFNMQTREFVETVYQRPDVDVLGGIYTPDVDRSVELAGFAYYLNGKRQIAWIDNRVAGHQATVDAAFPETRNTILDCFNNCAKMLVFTQSAQDPGSYYLIADGQAQYLGGQHPLLDSDMLGEEKFVTYTARDGREIPGILTMPTSGEPPYPTVILPHGGPWVSETRAYDEWPQVLATRGYMVLQPQYRGSEGYGLDHWLSSWGQWGLAMQDDKDDGALYLVEQGLADQEKLAMFGWSYGGYAAFAASVRTPQIYQCAIAGAGVSDLNQIGADFGRGRIGRALIREGYKGMSPVEQVENTNIPILVIHGEVDQRVPIYQGNRFVDGLKRHNKPYKYVILNDADHFSNTIGYENQKILYTELLNWLAGPCGMATAANPGSLSSE